MLRGGSFSSLRGSQLKIFEPPACCLNFVVRQPVASIEKTNCHIRARATKKFDQTLSLGCWNDWIVTPGADPNADRRKVRETFRNQRNHDAKQNCTAQYFRPEQQHARSDVGAV